MAFGKKQIIAAFLEKDNVKILAYEVSGRSATRVFGGQVSFGEDTLRDAFISDPVKFSSQVKMVLAQKAPLTEISEGHLFIHPDKTFIKALPQAESIDAFVKSLPFFKEELVIEEPEPSKNPSEANNQVNYVAFEKKLVEDFERPFLESSKKILSVESAIAILVRKFRQSGRYLVIMPFEKDVTVAACQDGVILDLTTFPKDVWVGRLSEFRMGKGYSDMTNVFYIGSLDQPTLDKLKNEQQLTLTSASEGDIYDLAVQNIGSQGSSGSGGGGGGFSVPKMSMPQVPGKKYLFLIGAAIIGFILVFLILKNLPGINLPGGMGENKPKPTPTQTSSKPSETPTPEAKPADFKVAVLNGTKVAGEAGTLGETLTGMGFDVTETANATTSGFVATRLRTTKEIPESIIDQIKEKLEETYKEVTLEPLDSSDNQIEVIIGEKKE